MKIRKHEERLYAARSETRYSGRLRMGCVRMVLAALALLLSLHANAQQGYAVLSADKTTLTFKYRTPSGTVNVNYYNADNTNFNASSSRWGGAAATITKVVFESSFAQARPKSCAWWFNGMKKLTTITGIENLNTSEVTNMYAMFSDCSSLTSLNVSKFSTGKVTDMRYMFSGCSSLTSLNISNFNTTNVTDMRYMFSDCRSLTSLDLTKFNTSKVTNMESMFRNCNSLISLDVTKFNTGNVTDMSKMFNNCVSLTSLNISNFNTSKVTTMQSTFSGCSSLTSLDVSNFDTSKVTNMTFMFSGCDLLTSLDLTKFNTSKVTSMGNMFAGCNSLISLDVSKFNTSNVTDMSFMFNSCNLLKSIDVRRFDTGNVVNMNSMFIMCYSLTSLDVSNFNTSKVKSMYCMFHTCKSLPSLDVTNFDTRNVTDMRNMFYRCHSLSSLDLRNFDTKNVTVMQNLAASCNKLKCIVFGKNFSTEKVSNLSNLNGMFNHDNALRYVDFFLSDDTDAINSANVAIMFSGAPETTVVYLPHGSQEIKDRTNFVYSYNGNQSELRCPMYYSVDKVDIEFPRQFITNEAVYDRTATMGSKEYGSATLPFAFTSNSDIQAYALTKQVKQNGKVTGLTFTNVSNVNQHTPFVFQRKNKAEFRMKDASGNFGITVYPVRSTNKSEKTWTAAGGAPEVTAGSPYIGSTGLSNWKTKGYYVKETVNDYNGMFFVQDDELKRAIGPLNLVDHRVLFYPTDGSGAASVFSLSFEDEDDIATAIEAAETEQALSEATAIYDASGCRLEEARKGLNIVRMSDGTVKKVFIK